MELQEDRVKESVIKIKAACAKVVANGHGSLAMTGAAGTADWQRIFR